MAEEEYEVEYICRAQVAKSGKKNVWKFEVKWKGYGVDANTWEPASSFKGSEHFIDTFWAKTRDTRDWRDLKEFTVGEIVFGKGPPGGGKPKGKSKTGSTSKKEPGPSKHQRVDDRAIEVIEDSEPEEPASKAAAEPRTSTRKRRASVVEDVEEVPTAKRRRGRPSKTRPEDEELESASTGSRLRKTASASKLPRIPAVKSKSKPAESSNASASTAAATQGTSQRRSNRKSAAASKEDSPEVVVVDTPIADDASSEADRRLVVESLDVPESDPGDGRPLGDTNGDVEMHDGTPAAEPSSSSIPPVSPAKIPAHRAREANPRIKMMDNGFTSQSGLSVKAALASASGSSNRRQSVLSPRARTNDSSAILGSTSLLTAGRNGGLVSIRKHVEPIRPPSAPKTTDNNEVAEQTVDEVVVNNTPPTAKEVLELAGLQPDAAEALPDYDGASDQDAEGESDHDMAGHDDHGEHVDNVQAVASGSGGPQSNGSLPTPLEIDESTKVTITETNGTLEVHEEQTIIIPKPLINPPTALIGQSSSSNLIASASAAWKRTTIFGPLGSGSFASAPAEGPSSPQGSSDSTAFLVVLSATVDLPVLLKDIYPAKTPSLKSLDAALANASRGTPGKFYKGDGASTIVSSFGVEGSSARILLDTEATEVQKQNFERFRALLKEGAVFVVMVGAHLLAFSASDNVELSSKLGMSPNLVGLGDNILVTEVTIQNDLLYLDATMDVEDEKW
ncbi:hypothetical protein BC629DRAFT_1462337 [Irpex lacteus]|nr:hypothetical protein BC629DRAFT_1462337 [Irpex lacteus]